MKEFITLLCILCSVFTVVLADFSCICNYDVEQRILDSPNDSAHTLGYMYEFDCNEQVTSAPDNDAWFAIATDHQIGYVKKADGVQLSICQGDPAEEDKLTTSATTSQTTNVPSVSTMDTYTTTQQPATEATTSQPALPISSKPTTPSTSTQTMTTPVTTPELTTTTTPSITTRTTTTPPTTPSASTSTPQPSTPATSTSATMISSTVVTTSATTETSTLKTMLPSSTSSAAPVSISTTAVPLTSISGSTTSCQSMHVQHATMYSNYLARYGDYCYELMPYQKVTWEHGEALCHSGGGHLVDIRNSGEQLFIQGFLQNHMPDHAVWIGLHDRNVESQFEWTSGSPVVYTNWLPGHSDNFMNHTTEDCVALVPYKNGTWDDIPCGLQGILGGDIGETHPIICKFDSIANFQTTTLPGVTQPIGGTIPGNTNICPRQLQQHAVAYGNTLAQYGSHCYELMPHVKVSWRHGENICRSSGGNLVYIGSEATQNFVESLLKRYMPTHAIWIGLHDLNRESQFEWTTGNQVSYTNWLPGHTDNFMTHNIEDCVALIPYKGGKWDDIPCGDSDMFIGDIGESHPIICQYDISSGPSMIG